MFLLVNLADDAIFKIKNNTCVWESVLKLKDSQICNGNLHFLKNFTKLRT